MLNTMFVGDLPILSVPSWALQQTRPPGIVLRALGQELCPCAKHGVAARHETQKRFDVYGLYVVILFTVHNIYIYISYIRSVWFICCDAMSYTYIYNSYIKL